MAKFKVGDKARINFPASPMTHRRACTILSCGYGEIHEGDVLVGIVFHYRVNIDGLGPVTPQGHFMAYEPHELEPLIPSGYTELLENARKWETDNPLAKVLAELDIPIEEEK